MKKYHGFLLISIAIGFIIYQSYRPSEKKSFPIHKDEANANSQIIKPEKSTIGSKENPQARKDYQLAMLVDPETGFLPEDIKKRSYLFSNRISSKVQSNLRRSEEDWRSIGPYNKGGRTRAIAIDITDEKTILAGGVSGGMWRSVDGGNSWAKTTVPISIHSVSCIAQDTRQGRENIWYYGSGEFTANSASKKAAPYRGDGVFRSTDGGITWHKLLSTTEGVPNIYNSQFQYNWKILPNPLNNFQDEVFLAAVGVILRSTNGGITWSVVLGRKLNSSPNTDLNNSNLSNYSDIVQTVSGVYYAVLSQSSRNGSSPDRGIYRSTNGVKWTNITPRNWPRNYARTVIATSKINPDKVYFSVNSGKEMLWRYHYAFGDGSGRGGVWQDLSENLPALGGEVGDYNSQNSYNMVLKVHPENENIVFLGGTNLYRSSDGFTTIDNTTWIGGYDTANNIKLFPNHFVDQHALAFYPSNPNKMISSNDGGIFILDENTSTNINWQTLNNGFVTTQFYTVGLNEFGSRGAIMGGLQDNGTLIVNKPVETSSWNVLLAGDGGYSTITKNQSYYYCSFQYGKVYRFTLDKNHQRKSFTRIDPLESGDEDKLLFINPYVLAPENQNIMYFAGGDVVWRNSNTSQIPLYRNHATTVNWQKMSSTEIDKGTITAINTTYNPSGQVFYGTDLGQVFRISNANESNYSVEEITSPLFKTNAYVSCIAIDRKDSKNIIVSFSNYNVISIFYSKNGGKSFESISGNLEQNPDGSGSGPSIRWVEIVSKNDGSSQYYAGASTGIFSTNLLDGIKTKWRHAGSNSVGNVVVTMIKYFSEDGTIVAATHGNGMYESKLDNVWKTQVENTSSQFAIGNPFPNPFVTSTNIPFSVPADGMVKGTIFSLSGQLIKTILWAEQYEGKNYISWNGTNEAGTLVSGGTYILVMEFENKNISSRLVFIP